MEYRTPGVYSDELTVEKFIPDADGFLTIPGRPGLGIEFDRDKLKRFTV